MRAATRRTWARGVALALLAAPAAALAATAVVAARYAAVDRVDNAVSIQLWAAAAGTAVVAASIAAAMVVLAWRSPPRFWLVALPGIVIGVNSWREAADVPRPIVGVGLVVTLFAPVVLFAAIPVVVVA